MNDAGRAPTITDLARVAGVSPGTVSRALADSPLIARATRERIQALAQAHGYRPNLLARNLRIRRTGAIGVLIPLGHESAQHISDPFFMTLLGHIADLLTERGYDLLLSRVIPDRPDWLSRMTASGRVDGNIIIGQSDQSDVIDKAASSYAPLLVWGAQLPDQHYCTVGTDNRAGGRLATRHLLERGVRDFAFLGDPIAPEIADRLAGVRDELTDAGISDALTVVPAHLTPESAHATISSWLDGVQRPPGGIVAASDIIALSALRALAQHGIRVPDQTRVVGYDDIPLAQQAVPPLTTIRQDLSAGAQHLVDLLMRRIAGEDTESVVLPPELIVRESA